MIADEGCGAYYFRLRLPHIPSKLHALDIDLQSIANKCYQPFDRSAAFRVLRCILVEELTGSMPGEHEHVHLG
jgi:hypothetical protein